MPLLAKEYISTTAEHIICLKNRCDFADFQKYRRKIEIIRILIENH